MASYQDNSSPSRLNVARLFAPATWTRSDIYGAALVAAFINGNLVPAIQAVGTGGWLDAIATGLGTNWIVWLGIGATLRLLLLAPPAKPTRYDLPIVSAATLLMLWPIQESSWLAVSLLSVGLLFSPASCLSLSAAGAIALAISVAKFWARLVPFLLSGPLTAADALFIGMVSGRRVTGNVIFYPLSNDHVSVTWSCSAFGNFSIVLLLFVTLARSVRPKAQRSEMLLLAALFGSTFLINSIRLLLETTNRGYYVALHSDSGGALFNFLTVATATALSLYWFRRDIHAYG